MIYCINGYGVPRDILMDDNYDRYLIKCVAAIRRNDPDGRPTVYLAGGATDPSRPKLTEAAEMQRWFVTNGADVDLRLLPYGKTLEANVFALLTAIGEKQPVTYFCEHARQDYTRLLVWHTFSQAKVVPIAFDAKQRPWSRSVHAARKAPVVARRYGIFVRTHVIWPLQRIPSQMWHAMFSKPRRG